MTARLPDDLELVRTTATFDQATVPAGLRAAHTVPDGMWGRLVVESGGLSFRFEDESDHQWVSPGAPAVIPPGRPHRVAVDGPVRFMIEFYARG